MATHIIIDGYNLLFTSNLIDTPGDLERLREELLRMLARYRKARGHRLTVVFDGTEAVWSSPRSERRGPVKVVFSRRGETADEAIVRRLAGAGGGWIVVTSDKELERSALKAGAEVVGSEEFASRVLEALASSGEVDGEVDGEVEAEEVEAEDEEPTLSTRKRGNPRKASRRARQRSSRLKKL